MSIHNPPQFALPNPSLTATERWLPWVRRWLAAFLWGYVVYTLLRTAWVCDDAFITFRCVENAVTGHGLGFNAGERVQAYTHPLWMLLLLPLQWLFHQPYWSAIGLSFLATALSFRLLARAWGGGWGSTLLPLCILASKSLIEYSTSGLENPLTHLLLAGFAARLWNKEGHRRHLWLGLIACGLVLNRMDAVLLVGPALAWDLWRHRSWHALRQVALGFLPFVLWEAFAVIYYGFPFPNTAYTKLATGIPQETLWEMGARYFVDSWQFDPATLPMIAVGITVGIFRKRQLPLSIGIVLYLVYIGRIGGDFMSGRFFAAPLVVALAVIGESLRESQRLQAAVAAMAIALGLSGPTPVVWSPRSFGQTLEPAIRESGVADERAFYFNGTGLIHTWHGRTPPFFPWVEDGKALARNPKKVQTCVTIGMLGYYAGPETYIIDPMGLVDPLLARMPSIYMPHPRPGHYQRPILEGHVASIESGKNFFTDPNVWDWHEKLALITRGDIWDSDRLMLIWRMNTGIAKPRDLSYLRVPTNRRMQLPAADTSTVVCKYNMGVTYLLPDSKPGQDSLRLRLIEGGPIIVAWWKDGEVHGGEARTHPGIIDLPVPSGADSVSIYPWRDLPQPIFTGVEIH